MCLPPPRVSGRGGRDHFAEIYRQQADREAEWLRRTARPKADSIVHLLRRSGLAPHSVLEIGAGTGAVIGAIRSLGVGTLHYAVDFSEHAIQKLHEAEPRVVAAVADVTETPDPFGSGPYDLGIASHVIEHLEQPGHFLRALRDVPMGHLVAEVPLEDLLVGRLKSVVMDRSTNAAGHVQFFTRRSFLRLLDRSGWAVHHVRVYAPVLDASTLAFSYGQDPPMRRLAKSLTERWLPQALGPLWTRVYHAHCTAICTKA
ncbi:MAG: class I SAM-dependent methyltransferase [Bacteroidota bacterium]